MIGFVGKVHASLGDILEMTVVNSALGHEPSSQSFSPMATRSSLANSGKQLWVFDGPIAVVSVVPITAQKVKSVHPYPERS